MKRTTTQLQQWLQAEAQNLQDDQFVQRVVIDSRIVQTGDLFIPFRGEHSNGHQYVRQAIEDGAVASLWLTDEPNPPTDLPLIFVEDSELALQQLARAYREEIHPVVIGVTGSNGKTSTKDLITATLEPYFKVQKTEGNFNNELGLPLTILNLDEDVEVAVLEMGMSDFGEISFLSKMAKPRFAVITNIGEAHMEALGSREGIARAKFEIIDGLQDGVLFYDGDEPLLQPLVEQTSTRTESFGYRERNRHHLVAVEQLEGGTAFRVEGTVYGDFEMSIYGEYQAKNALPALAIGHALGLSVEQMQTALKTAKLTAMRMEPVYLETGALVLNDAYNAAPTSMKAALNFLANYDHREKKWLVLGDMLELGEDELTYHADLQEAVKMVKPERVYLVGERMKALADALHTHCDAEIVHTLERDSFKNIFADSTREHVILLKGSRGMALEKLLP